MTKTPNDSWSILKAVKNKKEYSIRLRDIDLNKYKNEYIFKIGIAIQYNWKTETGFPSPVEINSLNDIEDIFVSNLDNEDTFIVGAITGDNVFELIFYSSNNSGKDNLLRDIINDIKDHNIQAYIEEDRNWDTYQALRGK